MDFTRSMLPLDSVHLQGLDPTELQQCHEQYVKQIEKFFDTMPQLSHEIEVENPNTKVKSTVKLEGLASFFG